MDQVIVRNLFMWAIIILISWALFRLTDSEEVD